MNVAPYLHLFYLKTLSLLFVGWILLGDFISVRKRIWPLGSIFVVVTVLQSLVV